MMLLNVWDLFLFTFQALMVDLGTDRFIRQVRLPTKFDKLSHGSSAANCVLSLRSENNRNINKLAVSCYESLNVVTMLIFIIFLYTDGWRGLSITTQTASCSGAVSRTEERHHQSRLGQRIRWRWKTWRCGLAHLFTMDSLSVHHETCSCKAQHLASLYFIFYSKSL